MSEGRPTIGDRDPGEAIMQMVEHVLDVASTWTAWDGRPVTFEDRVFTPHKAIRRVADHLVDHLAQLEAHLAGVAPPVDAWQGSAFISDAERATFTPEDLAEARCRLRRLSEIWAIRIGSVSPEDLDRAEGDEYTPREMAACVAGSDYYADAIGRVAPSAIRAH